MKSKNEAETELKNLIEQYNKLSEENDNVVHWINPIKEKKIG